eukprot:298958_1
MNSFNQFMLIVYVFMLLSCIGIFISEMVNRCSDTKKITINKTQKKSLRALSALTMILCIIAFLVMICSLHPQLWQYINTKNAPPNGLIVQLVSFSQITTLYHLFNNVMSKYIFIGLYLCGIILVITSISAHIINLKVVIDDNNRCVIVAGTYYTKCYQPVEFVWYYTWVVSIMFVYVKTMRKLRKYTTIHNTNQHTKNKHVKIINRKETLILYLLRKVLILTIFTECLFLNLMLATMSGIWNQYPHIFDIYIPIFIYMEFFAMFLMIEENDKAYKRVIYCVCCCCKTYFDPTINIKNPIKLKGNQVEGDEFDNNSLHYNL